MSRVRADEIVNKDGSGAPNFPYGATIGEGANWNAPTGIATFNSFQGNLTGIATITGGTIVSSSGTITTLATTDITGTAGTITTLSATTVSIGGTLTYEDVTNVDSVGLVTARTGVRVTAGGLVITAGVATFSNEVTAAGGIDVTGGVKVGAALTVVGALDVDGVTTLDVLTAAEEVKVGSAVTIGTAGLSTFSGGMKVGGGAALREKVAISTVAWSSSVAAGDINLDLGMVHLNTGVLAGTGNTLNITSSVGINTSMDIGDVIAVTGITSVSASTAFVDTLKIDHSTVQVAWNGSQTAPSSGGDSGYDSYAFNIIKTASATYAVVGVHIKTS